jgi:hypothetical protein
MHTGTTQTDPLLSALADLRTDLNRWLDAELQRLSESGPSSVSAQAMLPEVNTVATRPAPKARDESTVIVKTATAAGTDPVNPEPMQQADDPRQRLDALAKHLDRRMRRSRGDADRP